MNYIWNFNNIEVVNIDQQTNVVRSFVYELSAELDGYVSNIYTNKYYTSEGTEKTKVDNFTDYSNLTKDMFVSWVETSLGNELQLIKEDLARQVKQKILSADVTIVNAPWEE